MICIATEHIHGREQQGKWYIAVVALRSYAISRFFRMERPDSGWARTPDLEIDLGQLITSALTHSANLTTIYEPPFGFLGNFYSS